MTTNEQPRDAAAVRALRPAGPTPEIAPALPMPRLGRGVRWSDIVAEIEQDNAVRERKAA
jgi:hypothetical protein